MDMTTPAPKDVTSDIPVRQRATEEEAAAFRLDPHLVRLMWDEPFFSKVLRKVSKVRTDKIPTAGVLAKEGDIKMWWNPAFVAALTPDQIKGLMKHECFHLILEHTTSRRMDPHLIHNYATDLAINSMIPEAELPEGGLIPGKAFRELTEEEMAKMGPKAVGNYQAVSAKIASFPKGEASEWYFAELMKDKDVKAAIEEGQGGSGGEGGDESGDGGGEGGEQVPGLPGSMDDHGGWGELSDEERELVKAKVRQAVEEAVQECDSTGQWGSVGGDCRNMLRELVSKDIAWEAVLKQFCGMTRRAHRRSNVKRLHRKYPGIHPGMQKGYTSSIAVYIDQSGSVDNRSLELVFAELRSLARRTEFVLYNFDTEVDVDSERTWTGGKTPGAERTRCGGTDFSAATIHANKNKKRFDGYLIITDGECCDPGPSRLKRGWVIVPGRRLMFECSRRDFLVQMKDRMQKAA
jgi:predicted metal-dependent peptidase